MKLNFIGNNRGNWTIWSVVDFFFPIKKRLRMEARSFYDGARVSREFYTFRALYTHCFYSLFITPIKDIIKFHRLNPILAQRGAIAFDAVSTTTNNMNDPATFSHTCTGSNLVLTLGFSFDTPPTLSSAPTYNSVSMTQVNSLLFLSNNKRLYQYYLINPSTGANTVSIDLSAANAGLHAGAVSFSGANQTTQPDGNATASAAETNAPSVNVTTSFANTIVIDCLYMGNTSSATVGASQTQRWNELAPTSRHCGSTEPTTSPATVTMSWTLGTATGWGIGAMGVREVPSITSSFFQLL